MTKLYHRTLTEKSYVCCQLVEREDKQRKAGPSLTGSLTLLQNMHETFLFYFMKFRRDGFYLHSSMGQLRNNPHFVKQSQNIWQYFLPLNNNK